MKAMVLTGIRQMEMMEWPDPMITKDTAGNRKLDKHKATGRIDGIVAMAMALGLAFRHDNSDDEAAFNDFLANPLGI